MHICNSHNFLQLFQKVVVNNKSAVFGQCNRVIMTISRTSSIPFQDMPVGCEVFNKLSICSTVPHYQLLWHWGIHTHARDVFQPITAATGHCVYPKHCYSQLIFSPYNLLITKISYWEIVVHCPHMRMTKFQLNFPYHKTWNTQTGIKWFFLATFRQYDNLRHIVPMKMIWQRCQKKLPIYTPSRHNIL